MRRAVRLLEAVKPGLGLGAGLGIAGVGVMACSSSALAEAPSGMLTDELDVSSGLVEEEAGPPGEFKEMEQAKSIDLEPVSGLTVMATTVLAGGPSASFILQHIFQLGNGPQDGYQFSVASDSKTEAMNGVVQNAPDGMVLQAILRRPLTDSINAQVHGLFVGSQARAGRAELKFVGPDFNATVFAALGQRLGGNGVGLNYFQAVTRSLALGADTSFLVGANSLQFSRVAYSLYGAFHTDDTAVLVKYDDVRKDVKVTYWRQAAEKLKLGATMAVDLEKFESTYSLAYEMPIRTEDGGFVYTNLKGRLFSTAKSMAQVDHTLLNGQGVASVHASLDHFQQDYKVGVSLKIQS